jgi:hypothetical protein
MISIRKLEKNMIHSDVDFLPTSTVEEIFRFRQGELYCARNLVHVHARDLVVHERRLM